MYVGLLIHLYFSKYHFMIVGGLLEKLHLTSFWFLLHQQAGEFATGEEDAVDASGEARMRIAYREAAIALLECYLPNPHRPFVKVRFDYLVIS